MIHPDELREQCAARLQAGVEKASQSTAFLGLDGFVDEIIHVVDQRKDAETYDRLDTMKAFSQRLDAAAGHSTNIELVNQRIKLGGNGPIMANALACLGVRVTYLGALGYPNLHPVFHDFAQHAEVHSFSEPGHTDALEFDDGKVMLTKTAHFNELTWATIQARFGRDNFSEKFLSAHLVGFVNWTMIPFMSDIWESLLDELCPKFDGVRHRIFFDTADPEKRSDKDIVRALKLITRFQDHFDVIYGMNEKESVEVSRALGLSVSEEESPEILAERARAIQKEVPVQSVVIHPVTYALSATGDDVAKVDGPVVEKPLITTGAGDHFNAGFCLGKLLGLDDTLSLLTGVSTSGYYVRHARTPGITDLVTMLRDWPQSG